MYRPFLTTHNVLFMVTIFIFFLGRLSSEKSVCSLLDFGETDRILISEVPQLRSRLCYVVPGYVQQRIGLVVPGLEVKRNACPSML